MFKKIKKETFLLILIISLAAFLRFWKLGQVPPSPDWDEAALGYNAYSILKTGRDEYGQLFPLVLRSFDDYKPAMYVYLAIPAVKIFGLNTFAVRFPAALLGTVAVLLTYLLVKELFNNLRYSTLYALCTSFLLAISPWHIQFSRIAFESNVGLFFNILLSIFFLKGLKKPWYLLLAALISGLNIYVYQAEKVFVPLLVVALVLVWSKELLKLPKKYLGASFLVGLISVLPFLYLSITTPNIFLRAKGTSFASDQTVFLARTAEKLDRDQKANDLLGQILDNRRVVYVLEFINGYLSHFDLNWLFITGDDTRHHAPGMGQLYLIELPFLLIGIYQLLKSKTDRKVKLTIFLWFLIAPIPAAFSSGAPHAVRSLRMMPMIQILVAFGIFWFWNFVKGKSQTLKFLFLAYIFLFFIFNFSYYLNQYFFQLNYFTSQFWQYGYQQAYEKVKKIEPNYREIVVSNQPHLDQSYMFFLFYSQYDPMIYQKGGGTVSGGFAETHRSFSKYTFRPIDWENEEKDPNILFIGRPVDFPGGVKEIETINFLDGQPAIRIVEG